MRNIISSEEFIKQVHPESSAGRIVFERKIGSKKLYSLETSNKAEKIARLSYGANDLNFTLARFSGMPFLTNFERTKCLFVRLPSTSDQIGKLINKTHVKGFPEPTGWYHDSQALLFFWILEKSILRSKFYKAFIMQNRLYELLADLKPLTITSSLNSLVPFPATYNTNRKSYADTPIINNYKKCDNTLIENILMKSVINSEIEKLELHWRAVQELHLLWCHRIFLNTTSISDWLLFFGASLSQFCNEKYLKSELQALAVSLLNVRNINSIPPEYKKIIQNISESSSSGCIRHDGISINLNKPDWFTLVNGKLKITREEIESLGLYIISGEEVDASTILRTTIPESKPVGEFDFIPIERLFLREVA